MMVQREVRVIASEEMREDGRMFGIDTGSYDRSTIVGGVCMA